MFLSERHYMRIAFKGKTFFPIYLHSCYLQQHPSSASHICVHIAIKCVRFEMYIVYCRSTL
jgi:hypothetical protein